MGTILSLWDASELDRVSGGDSDVLPTFINLTDAAIHMVRHADAQPLIPWQES